MESRPSRLLDLPSDILLLVLEQLFDDTKALCRLGLVCRSLWHLSLPFLLRTVDLSSHNDGRQHEQEDEFHPEIHADYSEEYRPLSLVTRQRAFLRLMTNRPDVASHVRSLTWTLVWVDFDEEGLTEIDLELWNVFSRLTNVHQLDLATLHQIAKELFIRRNPSRLFPAVTHLRLLRWVHRGLVDAIISSLDSTELHTPSFDCLQDEGAFSNGAPMSEDVAKTHARHASNVGLYERQRTGKACVFPGPMWTPLRVLSSRRCTPLTKFKLRTAPFDMNTDLRNYFTCFDETVRFLSTVRQTLKSLSIVFGENPIICDQTRVDTARNHRVTFRRWNIILAADFLRTLLLVLSHTDFSSLVSVNIQGFHVLDTAEPNEVQNMMLSDIRELSRGCLLAPWQRVTRKAKRKFHELFEQS
ncbi:hypothetical protein K469DRAFT_727670 [Zopfia rhizophila CBS 207.26]|uniref:F-box domain-containing protein n=1 Tax=Zopfia rhizophila CBS 207.26 TaxID=1314779 RepID=A0A6A6E052_9PEZI|nr:hypothetical protein K469DRAFT_727670 [Zopfia rhizophila CBS 207.26]